MSCWKCKEQIDKSMELNFFVCEDFHTLCMKCRNECAQCHCNKDIQLNRISLEDDPGFRLQLAERFYRKHPVTEEVLKLSQPDRENTESMLINSLMINNMKKNSNDDLKNSVLKERDSLHDSLHSEKCLMNLDQDQHNAPVKKYSDTMPRRPSVNMCPRSSAEQFSTKNNLESVLKSSHLDEKLLKTNSVPIEMMPSSHKMIGNLSYNEFKCLIRSEVNQKLEELNLSRTFERGHLTTSSASTESSPRLVDAISDAQTIHDTNIDFDPSEVNETFINCNNLSPEYVHHMCLHDLGKREDGYPVFKTTKEMDTIMNKVLEGDREVPFGENLREFFQMIQDKYPKLSIPELKKLISIMPDEPTNFQTVSDYNFDFQNSNSELNISLDGGSLMSIRSDGEQSRVYRAYYSPPFLEDCTEPVPQFESLRADSPDQVYNSSSVAFKITDLNLSRSPVICPITACTKMTFISEFTRHIRIDHANIPFEKIGPNQCKNLFLDPKVNTIKSNKCHVLFLITNKIEGLGSREYRNYLPLMIMSTMINIIELSCSEYKSQNKEVRRSDQNYLMIWATGLIVPELPVYYNITVYGASKPIPLCHVAQSGLLYSIREPQDARSLYKSGQVLLLSPKQIRLLTNNGRHMIKLQVAVN